MSDKKISQLTGASTPLAGTEVVPIVQGSTTVNVAVSNLTAGRAISAASLALTTSPLPTTSGGTGLTSFTSGGVVYATSTSALTTSNNLFINGNGDVLVNATSLAFSPKFGVAADGSSYSTITQLDNTNTGIGSAQMIRFTWGGSSVGRIESTSTATSYLSGSDYRLKNNPQPLTNSGAFIDALKPQTWDWKSNDSRGVGFIAHEVQAVSPSSVSGQKDAVDEDGKPLMQAMEYGSAEFIANIVAELQSLRVRVAQLETKG